MVVPTGVDEEGGVELVPLSTRKSMKDIFYTRRFQMDYFLQYLRDDLH